MKYYFLTFVVALLVAPCSPAEQPLKLPAKENFHLFLLVGQSNMAGRGDKVHFDAASYREFGKRYAIAYLKLIESKKPSSITPFK